MFTHFSHSTFLIGLVFFLLAGIIGRHHRGAGILAPTLLGGLIALFAENDVTTNVFCGVLTGLVAGVCGVVIIPLFWAGRKGRPASNIRFMNHGAMSRTTLHFNWMKDDNVPEPGRKR